MLKGNIFVTYRKRKKVSGFSDLYRIDEEIKITEERYYKYDFVDFLILMFKCVYFNVI